MVSNLCCFIGPIDLKAEPRFQTDPVVQAPIDPKADAWCEIYPVLWPL